MSNSGDVKYDGALVLERLYCSGPKLEGVLMRVGHEVTDRCSKGAGESIEVADMVSHSGVSGSRYGFVVLINVTA